MLEEIKCAHCNKGETQRWSDRDWYPVKDGYACEPCFKKHYSFKVKLSCCDFQGTIRGQVIDLCEDLGIPCCDWWDSCLWVYNDRHAKVLVNRYVKIYEEYKIRKKNFPPVEWDL